MKALLLNGEKDKSSSLDRYAKIIQENLLEKNYSVDMVVLHEKRIADCVGCFGCWIKSPGKCLIIDDAQEIARKVINSDLVLYLTPVTFGGYSYQLKKALDRMISLVSPFFMVVNGEVHHKPRYDKYPAIAGIGVLVSEPGDEQIKIFNNLIKRNGINLHLPAYASTVLLNSEGQEEIQLIINNLLYKVGEPNG